MAILPIVLVAYYLIGLVHKTLRNYLLLVASLLFYAWGEPIYVFLLIFSILLNYAFGLLINGFTKSRKAKNVFLLLCVLANLGLLGYFKYFNFLAGLVNGIAVSDVMPLRDIVLPIGISFYTFQALSYVIDLYRGQIRVQKNPLYLGLYISLFPQLIAGPIVRYRDIENQLTERRVSLSDAAYGVRRFCIGLGKKVILANTFASVADSVFTLPPEGMSAGLAWTGILFYTFQIYYDFSGYSDMAIGLGRMFGFTFLENFNYPYISSSIREFWRRWHISLSTWFREYLYIPLGGNRRGNIRTYINLLIVFLLTGLWHGAIPQLCGLGPLLWGFPCTGAGFSWQGTGAKSAALYQSYLRPAGSTSCPLKYYK